MESFLWGHWYPCFRLLVTSPLAFKARVSSALFELSGGVRVTLHVPWDSPLVQHLPTPWWPAWQPSHLFHIPARHWWNSKPGAIMPPFTVWDQADVLPTELSNFLPCPVQEVVCLYHCYMVKFFLWIYVYGIWVIYSITLHDFRNPKIYFSSTYSVIMNWQFTRQ